MHAVPAELDMALTPAAHPPAFESSPTATPAEDVGRSDPDTQPGDIDIGLPAREKCRPKRLSLP